LEYLDNYNYYEVAMIALSYYDKTYLQALAGRDQKLVFPIKLNNTDHKVNADFIMKQSRDIYG